MSNEQKLFREREAQSLKDSAHPPARVRTWDECRFEEKVERLRNELRQIRDTLHYLVPLVHRLDENLRQHLHSPDGGPAVPLRHLGYEVETPTVREVDPLR